MLKFRLREQGLKYIHQKYCDINAKSDFSAMYESYHALGCNGVLDELYEEVITLPIDPPTEMSNGQNK